MYHLPKKENLLIQYLNYHHYSIKPHTLGLNNSCENNKTIPSGEQSSALLNKSKSDVPNNNTEVKADKKNICKNINDMDAGEGSY